MLMLSPQKLLLTIILLHALAVFAIAQDQTAALQACAKIESAPDESTSADTPPAIDVALEHWQSRNKFYLVVSATKSSVPEANLDFSKVNANVVAENLKERGYQPLVEPLIGEQATKNNFVRALKKINELPDNGLVVIYYSGHGVKSDDDSELWLQLYGDDVGANFGLSVTNLIAAARGSYHGDLILVIDSCFSGQGTLNTLTPRQLDQTTILTSSSQIQTSHIIKLPDDSQSSAFTFYLAEALTSGWVKADTDRDGILEHSELLTYLQLRLNCARLQHKIAGPMSPKPFLFSNERFFAYDQTKVRNWYSPLRLLLTTAALSSELARGDVLSVLGWNMTQKWRPSKRAEELSKLVPSNADPYSRALKLIAENKPGEAAVLLQDPTKIGGDLPKLYLAAGLASRYLGKTDEAMENYRKGLSLKPDNQALLEEIAFVYTLEHKFPEAEKAFEQAIAVKTNQLGPNHAELVDTLDRYELVLRQLNETAKADETKNQAALIRLRNSPGDSASPANDSDSHKNYSQIVLAVSFSSGSAQLSRKSRTQLDDLARKALVSNDYLIAIQGYADSTGSTARNRSLSERRTDAIIRYLVENHGIQLRRIGRIVGNSVGTPEVGAVADNKTASGRRKSRRAEITLMVSK